MRGFVKGISIILVIMMSCVACGKEQKLEKPVSTEAEYQPKLDALRPTAYGSISDLEIEEGAYLSVIGRYSDDSFWKEIEEGAAQAVKDLNKKLGYEGNKRIKINYIAPKERDNVDEQINILDEELGRYPCAIGIAAIDCTACQIQFDLAKDNGIPIVMMDSGSKYKDVAATCSTDNAEASETAAMYMAELLPEGGEVIVFVQDTISMTAQNRKQAFVKKIKKSYPTITIGGVYSFDKFEKYAAKIAKKQEIPEEDVTQEDIIRWILGKHPEAKGIYTTNLDTTQAVASFIEKEEITDVKMIGFDGGDEQLQFVEEGIVDGLLVQNPFGMGYATVVAMVRAYQGIGNEAEVDSGYVWITKENMNTDEIKRMMY